MCSTAILTSRIVGHPQQTPSSPLQYSEERNRYIVKVILVMKRVNILSKLEMNFSYRTFPSCCRCAWVLRIRLQALCVLSSVLRRPTLLGLLSTRWLVTRGCTGAAIAFCLCIRPNDCAATGEWLFNRAMWEVIFTPLLLFAPLPTPDFDNKKSQAPEKQQKSCDRKMHWAASGRCWFPLPTALLWDWWGVTRQN